MIDRQTVTEKIYSLLNFQKKIYAEDPDYILIDEALKKIPANRFGEFYYHLNVNKCYHNNNGVLLRVKIVDAVEDFIYILSQEIWDKYGLEKRTEELFKKMYGLVCMLHGKSAEEIDRYIKRVDIESIKEKNVDGPFFTDMELDILDRSTFALFLSLGKYEQDNLREVIERQLKTYLVKKYLDDIISVQQVQTLEFKRNG